MRRLLRSMLSPLLLVAAVPATPFAQPAQNASVSLNEAIARALDREPALRASRSDAAAARGMLVQAQLRPNPIVTATRQQEPAGMDNQSSIMVEWPLDLFRRAGRVNVATHEAEATDHRIRDRERALIGDVRLAYGAAAAALRNRALLDELASAAERQHALVQARVDAGTAPALERDMLAVDARRIESERLLQAAAVDRALFELKRLLGMAPDDPLSLTDSIEQLAPTEPFAPRPLSQVVADRGDVREADANLRLADARIDLARREGRVDMSVFGSYMRMDSGFPQLGIAANGSLAPIRSVFHYAAAGTTITLPLVNRRQGEIAAAQAQRSSADALLAAAQLRARTDVAAAMADDEGARAALAVYSSGVRALGRQNLDVVRQTYELGRATVNDVILEERRYVDLERAYTDLLTRAFEARTALQRAVGDRP